MVQLMLSFMLAEAVATRPGSLQLSAVQHITQRTLAAMRAARKFANAMHAPLIFTSASHSINVQKMFKVVLSKVFDLRCNLEQSLLLCAVLQ
eukprot:2083-Heterococcus_DN1.PRE.3